VGEFDPGVLITAELERVAWALHGQKLQMRFVEPP